MAKQNESIGHSELVGGNQTDLHSHASGSLPSGIIVMWSGLKANVPEGWYLCDGSNGTPDLRDRFVLSTGESDEPGGIGGSASYSHSGTGVADHPETPTSQADAGSQRRGTTTSTLTLLAHTHNTPVLAHVVTQPNDHTDMRPPYYKLAFIMKA